MRDVSRDNPRTVRGTVKTTIPWEIAYFGGTLLRTFRGRLEGQFPGHKSAPKRHQNGRFVVSRFGVFGKWNQSCAQIVHFEQSNAFPADFWTIRGPSGGRVGGHFADIWRDTKNARTVEDWAIVRDTPGDKPRTGGGTRLRMPWTCGGKACALSCERFRHPERLSSVSVNVISRSNAHLRRRRTSATCRARTR